MVTMMTTQIDLMQDVFYLYHDLITGRPTMRGGKYGVDMLPTTCHVYFGDVIGATANGRKANIPVSEGISPEKSADSERTDSSYQIMC